MKKLILSTLTLLLLSLGIYAQNAPTFTSAPVTTATEDAPYSYTATATDIDEDYLWFDAPVLPPWLTFDTGTHVLSGIPSNDDVGDNNLTLNVFDGTFSVEQSFVITVSNVNDAPVLIEIGDQSTDEGVALTGLSVVFTDADPGDAHTISVVSSDPNVIVANLSGDESGSTYDLVPAADWSGTAQITVTVTDNGTGTLSDSETYTLTVNAVNDTPTVITHGASDVYATQIVVFGEVSDEGSSPVTDRGICLSLSPNPGLNDNVNHRGSGPGFFTCQFNYLTPSTIYYYCAFATNAEGTSFGDVLSLVTMSSPLTITETISHISCFGADDGSIEISVSGGLTPYTYSWSNGESTQNISSLTPGTYSIFIYDAEYNQIAGTYEVIEPSEIEITGIVTDVTTCNGDATGSIQLNVTGGTPPYTIEWEHGPTGIFISDLEAGTYDVLVTDANFCEQTASFNVFEPDVLTILEVLVSDETCVGCEDGSIVATVSGGTPPYTFHWTGPDGFSSVQAMGVIAGLSTGDYYLEVTDNNVCTTGSLQIFVSNPLVVTNTDDIGAGSLRDAIIYANDNPGTDEIRFNIPGPDLHTITPATALPTITNPLVINGFTQPGASQNTNPAGTGFNTVLQIEIDGSGLTSAVNGLNIASDECEIHGLVINRFSVHGVMITGDNNIIADCFIGTNYLGSINRPNRNNGVMLSQGASGNVIGPGNLISGNLIGLYIHGTSTTGNTVIGNFLGTDATGMDTILNRSIDIQINDAPGNIIGGTEPESRNVFSKLTLVFEGARDNVISGNYIGIRASGDNALLTGNQYHGIQIQQASNNTIGPANVIGGCNAGIQMVANLAEPNDTYGNKIIGNLIGTNAAGSASVPNTRGIRIFGAANNTIGGTSINDRNIISGNQIHGILIDGIATQNRILGNYIGTDITGNLPIPNLNQGIHVAEEAFDNYIGTGVQGIGNLFAFNDDQAIVLLGDHNYILGNVIHKNGAGISIDGDYNIIGMNSDADRNIICGNEILGILVGIGTNHNIIQGNILGTDGEGREDKTDAEIGISILGSDNEIKSNLIAGYSENGIQIIQPNDASPVPQRNLIEENAIGLSLSRDNFISNGNGIFIRDGSDNIILKNEIAGNTGRGIVVSDYPLVSTVPLDNQFSQNLIYSNGELGIDLNLDGVTPNDLVNYDPDEGPNHLLNYPVLDSISFGEGNVTLGGYLRSRSDTMYFIEFFASGVGDATGYGEGEYYLGCDTVMTNDTGYVHFVSTLSTQGYGAQVITATATDLDGNTSEFSQVVGGVLNQVLAEMPFIYTLNSEGLSTVPLADYQNAIRSSFQTWSDIPTAEIQMDEAEESSNAKYASATDGLNLISFQDDRFPFANGVLAVTAKTLRMTSGGTEAEILDADIIFNPAYISHPVHSFAILAEGDTDTEAFDIQSVATHEIGHILGMIHSGVYNSTMFFMLGYGTTERELVTDDMAWASYRYPNENFLPNHGLISGRITYGDLGDVAIPSSHPPVAGALVLAVNTETQEMFHAYTDADGNYTVPIYMEVETDEYWIYIQPLDGDVFGTALKPANISPYIYSHTIYTDFLEEFYDDEESADDDPLSGAAITVSAGSEVTGIDLITNRDRTPPTVIGTSLDLESEDVAVSPTLVIKFSEPVDIYSFNDTTCYMTTEGTTVGGIYTLLADSTHIVLVKPEESLLYSTDYTLHIDGITDLKDNELETAYTSDFTTMAPDTEAPLVYDVIPAHGLTQVDVTKPIKIFFSEAMNKSSVEAGFALMTKDSMLVAGYYNWDLTNKEMTFEPGFSLEEGTDYLISLSTQIMDLSDNPMEEDTTFTFTTVDVAIPQIVYLGPADETVGITVETPVVVKFSEPLDMTTITTASFSLTRTEDQVQVLGTFEYLDDNRTIVFRPDQSLNFIQEYTVALSSDISDASEPKQYLKDTTTTFRTAPDVVVPHITYMEPPFGAVGAQTTIVGSGFDPSPLNNLVTFNGLAATVSKATLESLTVHVPSTADDGPVRVIVNGVPADNSFEFDVVPPNTDPSYNLIASSTTGSKTRAVVINPDAGYAYVTNWGDNTVTPIDISGNIPEPGTDIPVGIEPMDIALNPEGTLAYVTNYLSNTVSVIGTKQDEPTFHKVTKDIPVGYHPYGVVVSSDKKVYVANNESEYVSVIDVDPNSGGFDHVIANVTTGTKNRSIVVTPDAGLILVTGDNGVTIIDRDPNSPTFNDVIASASAGSTTRHITITPDAALALATTEDGVILIIDIFQPPGTEFGNVIASVKTGSTARNITISPDALYVYITNPEDNTVSVYQLDYSIIPGYGASLNNPLGLVHIVTIEVADAPYAIIGHPSNEYLLVTHDSDVGGVSKISTGEGTLDPIQSLEDLIVSVREAISERDIRLFLGRVLLYNLNLTLNRVENDFPLAAIVSLNRFILKVRRNMLYGQIPNDLGQTWLEAAYRIREQLVKDAEEKWDLKGSKVESGTGSMYSNSPQNNGNPRELIEEHSLKLENRPNPFSNFTHINFEIPNSGQSDIPVIMRVYNINGQVVKTLVHRDMEPGRYSVIWNCNLDDGGVVPSGIYLLEVMVPGERKAIRISVVK